VHCGHVCGHVLLTHARARTHTHTPDTHTHTHTHTYTHTHTHTHTHIHTGHTHTHTHTYTHTHTHSLTHCTRYERDLVKWLDADATVGCLACKAPWKFLQSRHHCRLCGTVMCETCSCDLGTESSEMIVATRKWAAIKLNSSFSASAHEATQHRQCKVTDKTPIRACRRCSDALGAAHATVDARVPFLRARRTSLLDGDDPIVEVSETLGSQLEVRPHSLCGIS
jgi:hypothetical protein